MIGPFQSPTMPFFQWALVGYCFRVGWEAYVPLNKALVSLIVWLAS